MKRETIMVVMICPSRHSDEAREYAREQLAPAGFKVDDEMVIDFSDVFPGDATKVAALGEYLARLKTSGHPVLGDGRFWGLMGVGGALATGNEDGLRHHPLVLAIVRGMDEPGDEPPPIDWHFDK